jgi:hypothetical protein
MLRVGKAMSDYTIRERTRKNAERIGVTVKVSHNPNKKLDVFKNGKKVASVGGAGYGDYPTYLAKDKALAEEKRRMYKARHEKDRKVVGSAGWYADKLLWE